MSESTTSTQPNPLSLVADDMRQVDAVIAKRLSSSVPLIGEIAHYIISAGGKRLRPVLLVLTCNALGCQHPQRHNLAAVVEGMVAVMHGPTGSARAVALDAPYRIAGKTGTAQRVSRKTDQSLDPTKLEFSLRHQALFVAFAPADAPRIALMVVVEHGGSGTKAAAPVARRILDAWLLKNPT